jgi:hypothetical protein
LVLGIRPSVFGLEQHLVKSLLVSKLNVTHANYFQRIISPRDYRESKIHDKDNNKHTVQK